MHDKSHYNIEMLEQGLAMVEEMSAIALNAFFKIESLLSAAVHSMIILTDHAQMNCY